jgi:microsomal dipeptidase-like Zn-dependent dipeptidase
MDRQRDSHKQVCAWARRRWQARIVGLLSRLANYQGPGDNPGVTGALMRQGDVGVTLSVLYAPFDEMDLSQSYGAPPRAGYFDDIVAELDAVEAYAASGPENVVVAHSPAELDERLGQGRTVLVHAVEGGFQLGRDEAEIRDHVATLAGRGVAYVTVAHLFWRDVATNAPALPFLPDWLYHLVFPQPDQGLSPLGKTAVAAMIEHGMLIDITHMSAHAVDDTFAVLEERDPARRVPLVATHMACRLGKLEYCLTDDVVRKVAERGGVLGLILGSHYITDGLQDSVSDFDGSLAALCRHIDRVHDVTGSFDHVAIGSDLDGYIKPALPGLEHQGRMRPLQEALGKRYGPDVAEQVSSANALRVLRSGWRTSVAA